MSAPGLRNISLGALQATPQTLEAILAENESLFVEHKSDIAKGEGYQIAKAAASFANSLGGWILIGVNDDGPIEEWAPPPGGFVDAVRQRFEGQLDPIPSFAADILEYKGASIGVIRVYESADTPHILLADGSIVVREPAQDAKLRKRGRYEATPIRSHYELVQLTQRGRLAEEAAEERFQRSQLPWVERSLRYHWTQVASQAGVSEIVVGEGPALILRASPLTMSARWREWAVSEPGVESLRSLATGLIDQQHEVDDPKPHPCGAAVTARELQPRRWIPGGNRLMRRVCTAVLDSGGVLGLRLGFSVQEGGGLVHDYRTLDQGSELQELVGPMVARLATALGEAEHLGRFAMHLSWLESGALFRVDPEDPDKGSPPPYLPCGGMLTIDGTGDPGECEALARGWSEELLRSSGLAIWGSPPPSSS